MTKESKKLILILAILTNFHAVFYATMILADYSPIPYVAIYATAI